MNETSGTRLTSTAISKPDKPQMMAEMFSTASTGEPVKMLLDMVCCAGQKMLARTKYNIRKRENSRVSLLPIHCISLRHTRPR